jgi:hypothetical protein
LNVIGFKKKIRNDWDGLDEGRLAFHFTLLIRLLYTL